MGVKRKGFRYLPGNRGPGHCSTCGNETTFFLLPVHDSGEPIKGSGAFFCPRCDRDVIREYRKQGATASLQMKRQPFLPYDTAGYSLDKRRHPIYRTPKCIDCRHFNSDEAWCLIRRREIKNPTIEHACSDFGRRGL